ncbi:hypothetical protein PspLS_04267 [Pyricularia sp. CBS 133598]|nr:hypothetical protein PspLS_04267 [Pyricularia sp. CBS 133598]
MATRSKANKKSQAARRTAQQTLHSPPSNSSRTSPMGPPRMDKQVSLLHLFYEPMNLLFALGETRGEHTTSQNDGSDRFRRRQFLNDLAYVCDVSKGGPTTTAIAVEEQPHQYIFWFALNATGDTGKDVGVLLDSSLRTIRQSLSYETATAREGFTQRLTTDCMRAASSRIRDEVRLLNRRIKMSVSKLGGGTQEDRDLVTWIKVFQDPNLNHMEICSLAYNRRKDHQMAILRQKGQQDSLGADINSESTSPYTDVQHYIGRLADHIRRPKRLIEHSDCFQDVFNNPYIVCQAPAIPAVKVPPPDGLTTVDGIVVRMLPDKSHPKLGEYQAALQELDRLHGVLETIKKKYSANKPCIHAEILVLEHFWAKNRAFAFSDRFIGCSKPACYCCKQYIKYHPIGCVVPDSHEKIYINWSPPLRGVEDPGFKEKKKVIQGIINSFRASALEQILQRTGRAARWHPDSVTGITRSLGGNGSIAGAAHTSSVSVGALQAPTAAWLSDATSPMLAISEDDTEPDSDAFARLDLSSSPDSNSVGSPATSISSAPFYPNLGELEPESDSDSEDGGGVLLYGPGSRRHIV